MFRTFRIKGTKDGFNIQITDSASLSLLCEELTTCFQDSRELSPVPNILLSGLNLSPLTKALVVHTIKKVSDGHLHFISDEDVDTEPLCSFKIQPTVRSGEMLIFKTTLLIKGSVHSGSIVQSLEGDVIILDNLSGTVIVSPEKRVYVGKECDGQIRIGEHIYFPNSNEHQGLWMFERMGKLYLEDNGGQRIDG